jgi:2-methylcitrate dehydratase PrpD
MTTSDLLGSLVDQAFADAIGGPRSDPGPGDAEHLLLADFLACVDGADPGLAPRGWHHDGTAGSAAALGVLAHARDQDDIHWATGIHPGSVIWPVALALGAEVAADGERVAAAARAGYNCMAALATLFGPVHGQSWHATATCGALGAAAAAATILDLGTEQRLWACGHAVAVAGGVGQAVAERSGTATFHRAACAVVGIVAARLAQANVASSRKVLEGDRGILALFNVDATFSSEVEVFATLPSASVRLYPVNGLAQAAVGLAADLRQQAHAQATSIVVEVSDFLADATTGGPAGSWWDLRHAVAAAWSTGDPFDLEPTSTSAACRERVRVVAGSVGRGTTRITVETPEGDLSAEADSPPGLRLADPRLGRQLDRKWDRLAGPSKAGAELARERSAMLLSRGPRIEELAELLNSPNAA